jgi:flagellar biosynthesis/type III secretory pathway chaperone
MNMIKTDTPQRRTARPAPGSAASASRSNAPSRGDRAPQATKVEDIFQIIRQLCDLLTKENTALKRHRNEDVSAMTERKDKLSRLYQGHINTIHRDPSQLQAMDPAKRTAMAQAAMRLGDLMQENASLLKANIESINMFFKAVTNAVRDKQEEKAAAYSSNGAMNPYGLTRRNLAVSYNQTM